jgi:hypothetical protein
LCEEIVGLSGGQYEARADLAQCREEVAHIWQEWAKSDGETA